MNWTRRQLTGALTSGAVLTSAFALTSTAALAQTPAPPSSPEAELQSARDQVKAIAMTLQQQEVPMSTEPAFVFQT